MKREVLFSLRGNTSRTVVANDLNITPQMLGAIERGDRTPSLSLAKKIADYYGTTVDEIFFAQSGHKMCPLYETSTDKGA
ncbi:helix-turn-helix transcriptional regulator [Bacillus subtilis]|uniref:helix-turn-helix transcriptional regulator n=1 Tax=Bacillus subtilis TaxID=1423 RepID=UPI000FF8EFAA|nr:helix-turn-helix domain-containing protein [Bacillus subtilis]MED1761281.1 helix-turn-helix domain-containing protein [Bacillus subtilis]QAS08698.1 helix-turn-helix domain-containing protein [Bacillus subtilis]QAT37095.1 helix-turn-helix domain-containing protein [Bacillus subtilis]QAW46530.1 helix-turn-helix domain-containing protein [Bacillus subtilis]